MNSGAYPMLPNSFGSTPNQSGISSVLARGLRRQQCDLAQRPVLVPFDIDDDEPRVRAGAAWRQPEAHRPDHAVVRAGPRRIDAAVLRPGERRRLAAHDVGIARVLVPTL